MHPEIEAALTVTKVYKDLPVLSADTLQTAEKLLSYMEDINLERTGKFIPTIAESLYISWTVQDWVFHMECVKNGDVLYSFLKGGYEAATGSNAVDEFIPKLQQYLLLGVA